MEHFLVFRNKLLLLFVYGPLSETSEDDGGQKSGSSDDLRYQRYGETTQNSEAALLQQTYGDGCLKSYSK